MDPDEITGLCCRVPLRRSPETLIDLMIWFLIIPLSSASCPSPSHWNYFSSKLNWGGVGPGQAGLLSQEGESCCCFSAVFCQLSEKLLFHCCLKKGRFENVSWKTCQSQGRHKEGNKKWEVFGSLTALSPSAPSPVLQALHKQRKQPCTNCSQKGSIKITGFPAYLSQLEQSWGIACKADVGAYFSDGWHYFLFDSLKVS